MKKKMMLALVTSLCFTLHAQLSNVYYVGQTMTESGMTVYVYDVDYNYMVQTMFFHSSTEIMPDGTPVYVYGLATNYAHTQTAAYNEIRGGPIGRVLDAYNEGNFFEDSQKLERIAEAMEDANAAYSTRLVWRDIVEQMITSSILSEPYYKVQGYEVETNPFDRIVSWQGRQEGLYFFNITDMIFSREELTGNVSIRNREGHLVYDGPVSANFLNNGNKSNP